MKKIQFLALMLCGLLVLSACSSGNGAAQSQSPAESSAVVEQPEEDVDAEEPTDEAVEEEEETESLTSLPQMEPEFQQYADTYLMPAELTLLRYNFGLFEYTELLEDGWPTLAMIAEDFYRANTSNTDWEACYLAYWEIGKDGFPREFFEETIQQYLPIRSELIQAAFGEQYAAEEELYFYEDGRGGPAYTTAVVTGAERGREDLVIDYDLYTVLPDDVYEYTLSGQLVVEINGEQFTYVSNTIQ